MAADPDGGTRCDGHLPPLPRTGEPTATSRASGGSSSRRSEASGGAACHADDAEGMTKKMALAEGAIGGRGGHYCRPSSCGSHAAPLTHHPPSSPPVSSRGGGNGRKNHGGGDASSFITPLVDDEQERLSTGGNFLKAARHASLPDMRVLNWNAESDGSVEGSNQSAEGLAPSVMPQKLRITLQKPKPPSLLGCIFTKEYLKKHSSCAASKTLARVHCGKEHATGANTAQSSVDNDARVGYGDPHPPPIFKCQVCKRRTAFYRLKCCRLVICELCGCNCDRDDLAEDKYRQSQVGKKEKLPKVKLEGSNLFLWRPFSFPSSLMLCMAKRTGEKLQCLNGTPDGQRAQRDTSDCLQFYSGWEFLV